MCEKVDVISHVGTHLISEYFLLCPTESEPLPNGSDESNDCVSY